MGFYFRKSKNLFGGLFRLNFSKRGVGVSTGVKGARFVVGPAGTYVHLGQKGFYYKKYLGKGLFNSDKEKEQYNQLAKEYHLPTANEIPNTITTKNFDRITDSESADFIRELEEKDKKIKFFKIFGLLPSILILAFVAYKLFEPIDKTEERQNIVTINSEAVNLRDQPSIDHSNIIAKSYKGDKLRLISETENNWYQVVTAENDTLFVHGNLGTVSNELIKSETIRKFDDKPNMRYTLFGLTLIPLVLWNFFLYRQDKKRKSIFITYELDEVLEDLQKDMISSFKVFARSNKKWQIVNTKRNYDVKYTAGAGITVDRKEIKEVSSHKLPTPFFETNIEIPFIALQNTELYFLPDRLLLKRNNKFAAVQYGNIDIRILPVSFREYNGVPSDATVTDYTYKYVNKNGGADRRFANNPRVPICAYTEYHFSSDEGINEVIMPSKTDAMDEFIIQLKTIGKLQNGYLQQTPSTDTYKPKANFSQQSAPNPQVTYQKFDLPNYDELFQEAAQIIVDSQTGSTSLLQRKLTIGYNRAGRLIDELEEVGIVGSFDGSKPRNVFVKNREELNQLLSKLANNEISKKEIITREYYDLLTETSNHLSDITDKLKKDETFTDTFKHTLTDSTPETFVPYCVLFDTAQILKMLTNGQIKRDSLEMTGLVLLSMKIIKTESDSFSFDYETVFESHLSGRYKSLADSVLEIANKSNPLQIDITETKDEELISNTEVQSSLSLPPTLKLLDHPLFDDYVNTLYRFATIIAKADNNVTKKEEEALKEIYQITHNPVPENENKAIKITEAEESENLEQVLAELENLIGLDDVKREVKSLINFIQIQKEREKQGLKNSQISYHCVFTGSPGTGKTTIARIVAKIYKHLGILEKGHLVETDRSGLVAEYTGQTAVKVTKTVNSALDGILFIDEAYALVGENKDDFGKEAVATLIKRMEDNRDKLVLIVAGYSDEMKTFIDTNPGFKSRFNRYIHFPDYTPDEMIRIFELLCSNSEYTISPNAKSHLTEVFKQLYENKTKDFGNGRLVRNIFEKSIENQSNRIALADTLTKVILTTIETEDIPSVSTYTN